MVPFLVAIVNVSFLSDQELKVPIRRWDIAYHSHPAHIAYERIFDIITAYIRNIDIDSEPWEDEFIFLGIWIFLHL